MIIVSQNRRRTINFNRIVELFLEFSKDEHKYLIKCEKANGKVTVLAKYHSEKQAETVIDTFNKIYGLIGQAVQFDNGASQMQLPVYYMPNEIKEER